MRIAPNALKRGQAVLNCDRGAPGARNNHPSEPATGMCARCGKYVCNECIENFAVNSGEFADKCLCYDCWHQIVTDNIANLRKQRSSVIVLLVATAIGMIIGLVIGIYSGSWVFTIFATLWIGSFWSWIKGGFSGWWNNPRGRSAAGFLGAFIGSGLVAPILTIKRIIMGIADLVKISNSIRSDSAAISQMRDYMSI